MSKNSNTGPAPVSQSCTINSLSQKQQACPHCGYCPTCGRRPPWHWPWPYPHYPYPITWQTGVAASPQGISYQNYNF